MSKSLRDGLTLGVRAAGEDVDDGLLVRAEALHGGAQRGRVFSRIEVGYPHYGRFTLATKIMVKTKAEILRINSLMWLCERRHKCTYSPIIMNGHQCDRIDERSDVGPKTYAY